MGSIEVVELTTNVGDQKAIAIGLSYLVKRFPDAEIFTVMDDIRGKYGDQS
jgi:hypothetical protein